MANTKSNQLYFDNKQMSLSEKLKAKYLKYKDQLRSLKYKYKIKSHKLDEIKLNYHILEAQNKKKDTLITELQNKLRETPNDNWFLESMAKRCAHHESENKALNIKMKEMKIQCDELKQFFDLLFNANFQDFMIYFENDFSKNKIWKDLNVTKEDLLKLILPQITEEHEKLKYQYLNSRQQKKFAYFSWMRNGLVHHNTFVYHNITFKEILNAYMDIEEH